MRVPIFFCPDSLYRIQSLRKPIALLAILSLSVSVWGADAPWKAKDQGSWTQEDVLKILYDSPWVKMVEMDAPWIKGPVHFLTVLPVDCDGRPNMDMGDRTPVSWKLGGASQSLVVFQVTWQSARMIRAGKVREAVLCDRVDEERGAELMEKEQDDYVITVNSPDMAPFEEMTEEDLIKNTTLTPKKTGKAINATDVHIMRIGRKKIHMLTFRFPKKLENGEPVISTDEKEVEFLSISGKFKLKTKFQLSKMAGEGGLDL